MPLFGKTSKFYKTFLFAFIITVLTYTFWNNYAISNQKSTYFLHIRESLLRALREHASANKTILLSVVGESFVDMVVNFQQTSLLPLHISNVLFLGSSLKTCQRLEGKGIACFVYTEDPLSNVSSAFFDDSFFKKARERAEIVLYALQGGFTVLHTDVDVHFFKDPFPLLHEGLKGYDMAAMWDLDNYNVGFIIIKPSARSIQLYEDIQNETYKTTDNDQVLFNRLLSGHPELRLQRLNTTQFSCGGEYFEEKKRFFAAACEECVVVHNNWIVSKEAKVYRFKEHLMWTQDEDGYYTSATSKYLTYSRPTTTPNSAKDWHWHVTALKSALALARLLDRKVILPRFFDLSRGLDNSLNSIVAIEKFDKHFGNQYRESTFLSHPLVPESLKLTSSHAHLFIATAENSHLFPKDVVGVSKVDLSELAVVSGEELQRRMLQWPERLLHLHHFDGVHFTFPSPSQQLKFSQDAREGIIRSNYRQI